MAIENHPILDDGSPFPTLFWLTCPILVKRVSTLEAGGRMNVLNEAMAHDRPLRTRLAGALSRYVKRRDAHAVIETGPPPGGGPGRVKCLHAHVAQQLSDPPNPVGALTVGETGWPDCIASCVEVSDE